MIQHIINAILQIFYKYCPFCPLWSKCFAYMGTGLLIFTTNGLISFCGGGKLSSNVLLHVSQCFYTMLF